MISPKSTSKVCQLSGCSSTSGTCYKEGHTHSYSCPSGSYASSSSCSYGTSGTTSKKCSCGATSGTCYKCATHSHSYSCPSGSYSSSSSCSYGTDGTTSKVCSCGATSSGTCYYCAANPCDDNPCASGCYKDLSCQYGCASWNSCDGCSRCKSAPSSSSDPNCPQIVCEGSIIGGKYSDGVCSKNCEILKCNNKCVCESVNGGTLIDGYCTEYCVGMCADVSIEGGGGWG